MKTEKTKKLKRSSLIYKFCFFLHSTLLYLVLSPANYSCGRPSPSPGKPISLATQRPRHSPNRPQPPTPRSGRATAPVDHNLPRHAAATDCASHTTQRRHIPDRRCHGHCHLRPATITQQPHSKLINGKNQKIIWPNMDLNFAPLGRSYSISTARPPPLMWCVVLFKFTYNCPFVNNV
jgi:hypothetical protein